MSGENLATIGARAEEFGLYGESRHLLLAKLAERLQQIKQGNAVPRIIVLEGESGTGKSTLVRAFYELLREETIFGRPQYWPPFDVIESHVDGRRVAMERRKLLGPKELDWKPGALPTFLWLPLYFAPGEHMRIADTHERIRIDLTSHAPAVIRSRIELVDLDDRVRASLEEQLRKLKSMESADARAAVLGILSEFASIIGVGIPGTTYMHQAAEKLYEVIKQRLNTRQALRQGRHVGGVTEALEEQAAKVVADVKALLAPNLPAVVVIEDVHWMSKDLDRLLDELGKSESDEQKPVLVVATAWPEANDERAGDYLHWLSKAKASGRAELWKVDQLEGAALRQIVDYYAPATDEDTKELIIRRWTNPFALELFLGWCEDMDYVGMADNGRRLEIDEQEIGRFPSEIKEIYAERWKAIEQTVQQALIAVTASLPEGRANQKFEIEVVAAAVSSSEVARKWAHLDDRGLPEAHDAVRESLLRARSIAWTMWHDAGEIFREPVIADVVDDHRRADTKASITLDLRRATAEVLRQRIATWTNCDPSSMKSLLDPAKEEHRLAAHWLIDLASDAEHVDDSRSERVARLLVAEELAQDSHYADALALLPAPVTAAEYIIDPEDPRLSASIRIGQVSWTAETGETEGSIEFAATVVRECEKYFNGNDPSVVAARLIHAHRVGIAERKKEAYELYVKLDNAIRDDSSVSAVLRARARSGRALWTGEAPLKTSDVPAWSTDRHMLTESVRLFTDVVEEFGGDLGRDHPVVLEAWRAQGRFTGEAGDTSGAVSIYRYVVAFCASRFGPLSTQGQESLRGLARWLLADGQIDEARARYEQAVADCEQAFGPVHILSMWARLGLGQAQRAAGDASAARATLTELQADVDVHRAPSHRLHAFVANEIARLP